MDSATPEVTTDVKQQITSVVMGYGIETTFTLVDEAYAALTEAISSAKSTGSSLSIFGALYGTSGMSPKFYVPGLIGCTRWLKVINRWILHFHVQLLGEHPDLRPRQHRRPHGSKCKGSPGSRYNNHNHQLIGLCDFMEKTLPVTPSAPSLRFPPFLCDVFSNHLPSWPRQTE